MHSFWWIVIGVLAVGAVIGAVLVVRRRLYLKEVRELGWSHNANPSLADVADLNAPPFGMGLNRSVDELVSGTTPGGFLFRAFEYDYTGAGPKYSDRVAAVQVPLSLPDAFVCGAGRPRAGVGSGDQQLVQVGDGQVRVIAVDGGFAHDLLESIGGALAAFAQVAGGVDLSVEGRQLVASGAPKDPDELREFLAALDPVAHAVAGSPALAARQVPPSAGSGFCGHPDWRFVGSDDSVLNVYPTSGGGYAHRTEDLIWACGTASAWTRSPTPGRPTAR